MFLAVAVGVVYNQRGQVFITRRAQQAHQGGLWEFPGGKREPQESRKQALCRELTEELGITVHVAQPLIQVRHQYPDRHVLLDVWQVRQYAGEPKGMEGQPGRWVDVAALSHYAFPAADAPIIKALALADHYIITAADATDLAQNIQTVLHNGARFVQLRLPQADKAQMREIIADIQPQFRTHGAKLLLNRHIDWVAEMNLDGVHLTGQQLREHTERPLSSDYWVAASCHNAQELQLAQALSVDFVVLSPVKTTLSHPTATPIGWAQFAAHCAEVNLPVYALGGVEPQDLAQARQCGGRGVAGIRGFGFA